MRITIFWIMLLLTALLAPSEVRAHVYCPKAECEEVKQKIKHIESKLRHGYTRSQGEKLQAQLRKLRAIRSKKCR